MHVLLVETRRDTHGILINNTHKTRSPKMFNWRLGDDQLDFGVAVFVHVLLVEPAERVNVLLVGLTTFS